MSTCVRTTLVSKISNTQILPEEQTLENVHKSREGRAENTAPRRDRTETGLRSKPIAHQLQPGAYDLYRTCRLRITGTL